MRPSEALAAHREALRQLIRCYNVAPPRIFGSVLTGQDTETSDLDLLVDPVEGTTLFTLGGLQHEAEELLGVRVSVLTPRFLAPHFRAHVLDQAQPL
jgi:predicted nucleotidyltransferase